MDWQLGLLFGAIGGGIVELVVLVGKLTRWQSDREKALLRGKPLRSWRKYVDLQATVAVGAFRMGMGAIGGLLFHTQILTAFAAVAVGASAPALLKQFSANRSMSAIAEQEQNLAGGST